MSQRQPPAALPLESLPQESVVEEEAGPVINFNNVNIVEFYILQVVLLVVILFLIQKIYNSL